jgi:hypothetical protein
MISLCHVCGNDAAPDQNSCIFCGASLGTVTAVTGGSILHRVINIERGRPLVETALRKMENELARARMERVLVITLIHGYGSSGKGGRIRTECRKVLDHLKAAKKIKEVVAGEEFRKRTGPGKYLVSRFPELTEACRSDFSNPGVTIVVI